MSATQPAELWGTYRMIPNTVATWERATGNPARVPLGGELWLIGAHFRAKTGQAIWLRNAWTDPAPTDVTHWQLDDPIGSRWRLTIPTDEVPGLYLITVADADAGGDPPDTATWRPFTIAPAVISVSKDKRRPLTIRGHGFVTGSTTAWLAGTPIEAALTEVDAAGTSIAVPRSAVPDRKGYVCVSARGIFSDLSETLERS